MSTRPRVMHQPHASDVELSEREARARRLIELADDVRDMGSRVVSNGGEPNYASEKLGHALRCCVRAIATVADLSEDELVEIVRREHQDEHESWALSTCEACHGFGYVRRDGRRPFGDEAEADTIGCRACRERGEVLVEVKSMWELGDA